MHEISKMPGKFIQDGGGNLFKAMEDYTPLVFSGVIGDDSPLAQIFSGVIGDDSPLAQNILGSRRR